MKLDNKKVGCMDKKVKRDKLLLNLEIVLGIVSVLLLLVGVGILCFVDLSVWLRILISCLSFAFAIIGIAYALKIEQIAGFYECKKCKHKYVPSYLAVIGAPHVGRTRYLKCPVCGKKTWSKKVID